MDFKSSFLHDEERRQRICHLERGPNGFGFVLCCENDTTDTFVLHVLNDSPASEACLRTGDKIIEINGINVESECHTDVVKILQGLKNIRLVVVFDKQAHDYFSKPDNGMTVRPLDATSEILRPKHVIIHRGPTGYDFVVKTVGKSRVCNGTYRQTMRGVTGHFVESVAPVGRAYAAGLRPGERIIEINQINVERESHAYVIAAIKTSSNKILELLVVDKDTDEFFSQRSVSPSSYHLHGELNFAEIIDKSTYDLYDGDLSPPVSPVSSSRVSTTASTPTSDRSPIIQPGLASIDAITRKTEELIKELRIHNDEIMSMKSSLGYSKSYVEPSLRDKYLNLVGRDVSSNPGSPRFLRNNGYRSTTSSSDDDHSLATNNNHKTYNYKPVVKPVKDLSEVEYNVDLKTLKEHARRKVGRNKTLYRDKVGFGSYLMAHRAVNNI